MDGGEIHMWDEPAGQGYQSFVKHRTFRAPFYGKLVIPNEVTYFINMTGNELGLSEISIDSSSLVLDESFVGINITGEKVVKNGFGIMDNGKVRVASVGDEKLPVIGLNVTSGHYALGGFTHILTNERLIPDKNSIFYPFQVSSDASLINTEPDMINDPRENLETAVAKIIQLLQSKKCSLYSRLFIPPDTENPEPIEVEVDSCIKGEDDIIIHALKTASPIISGNHATYDLGDQNGTSVSLFKMEKHWLIDNQD